MGEAFLVRKGGGVDASDSTATSADIIQGKKAYIDDSGEAKAGTIPLNSGQITGTNHMECDENIVVGNHSLDNKQRLYIRPTAQATARQAYEADSWFTKETSKLAPHLGITADKIVKDNTICGVTGTANTDGGISNFPVTVSLSQPSPQAVGHVWVQTNRISTPTRIYVRESVGADMIEGSLIFTANDMTKSMYNVIGKSSGIPADLYYESGTVHDWLVGGLPGYYYYYLQYPRVYTKVNGTIYIENAYIWNGSIWVLVSNADRYFLGVGSGPTSPYQRLVGANWIGGSLTPKEMGLGGTASGSGNGITCNRTGKFISQYLLNTNTLEIYKREGDTFTIFQTLSASAFASYFSGNTPRLSSAVFSSDGIYMAVLAGDYNLSNTVPNRAKVFKYKLNTSGTNFDMFKYDEISNIGSPNYTCMSGSDDLSVILLALQNSASYFICYSLMGNFTDTQTLTYHTNSSYFYKPAVSGNGLYGTLITSTEGGYAFYFDVPNRKTYFTSTGLYANVNTISNFMSLTNNGEFISTRAHNYGANVLRIVHYKITLSGTTLSVNYLQDKTFYTAESGITDIYAQASAISYYGDQNNCYITVTCGSGNSSYGSRIRLYKGVFSGGALTGLSLLSETNLAYQTNYYVGLLIGGQ